MTKLSGKIAVVTGGTGALGRTVTKQLLSEGAFVVALHTGQKESDQSIGDVKRTNPKFTDSVVDVVNEASVTAFFDRMLAQGKTIDILCNLVGGVLPKNNIEDISVEDWQRMINLNLTSCFLMMRGAVRMMKKNGFGRIINIASMPALLPEPQRGAYGVSKAGVIHLTKTVAQEVKHAGDITVNAIAPSIIVTEENLKWGTQEEIKQWVTPDQIAAMIILLCSEHGSAMNGDIIQMYGKV